jgi:hypothetical protein
VIPNEITVQIMRPGMGLTSASVTEATITASAQMRT